MQEGSLTALVLYALATSITPGPNNLMLMASGVNFGIRRTLSHVFGVVAGFALLLLGGGAGIAELILWLPAVGMAMRLIMAGWVLWMAWRLATMPVRALHVGYGSSGAHDAAMEENKPRPMNLLEAMLFQWVNPKAWMMVLGVLAIHLSPDAGWSGLFFIAAVYAVVMLPCILLWVVAGRLLQRWLGTPGRQRMFNVLAAIMLAASLYPLLLQT